MIIEDGPHLRWVLLWLACAIESAIEKGGGPFSTAHLVAKLSAGSSSVPLYNQTAGNSLEEAPQK